MTLITTLTDGLQRRRRFMIRLRRLVRGTLNLVVALVLVPACGSEF